MLDLVSTFLILFFTIFLLTVIINPKKVKNADDLSSELYSVLMHSAGYSFALIFSLSLFTYARTGNLVLGLTKEHINLAILLTGFALFILTLSELFKYWTGRTVKKKPQKIPKEKPPVETPVNPAIAGESGQRTCPQCGGRGNTPCPNLDCKDGYIYHHPFSSIALFGEKKTKCQKCKGSDIALCEMCNATGKVTA